jgi:hypothetical protein
MAGLLVLIKPEGQTSEHPYEKRSPGLERLQELVGGYIERVKVLYKGKMRDAFVDEDGLSKGLPYNLKAVELCRAAGSHAFIVGNMVIEVPARLDKRMYNKQVKSV